MSTDTNSSPLLQNMASFVPYLGMDWPKTCILCGSDDKNRKKHFISAHLGTSWWGLFPDRTCWKCNHYESTTHIETCRSYGTNGTFNPVSHYMTFVLRVRDFLNFVKLELGLNELTDILSIVQTKRLSYAGSIFCQKQVEHCKIIDEYFELSPKTQYSPANPTRLSELFHWQTLTLIFDYCDKVGTMSGPLDNHVPITYIDSHCHVDRLQTNFGVSGSQDVITALYAEVKDDRYEGCISNLVDPWLWDGPLHSAIVKDPKVHVTVGLHPKHYDRMGDQIKNDLERMITLPTVVGFGEIGLDYNRATQADKDGQMESFRDLLKIAAKTRKTVIIHGRDAFDDVLAEMKKELIPSTLVHYHSFEEGLLEARQFLDAFPQTCFGLTGKIVTRQNHMTDLTQYLPLENLICETDSPYFPTGTHPYSCPADVLDIMRELARRRGKSLNEIMIKMRLNTLRLYRF